MLKHTEKTLHSYSKTRGPHKDAGRALLIECTAYRSCKLQSVMPPNDSHQAEASDSGRCIQRVKILRERQTDRDFAPRRHSEDSARTPAVPLTGVSRLEAASAGCTSTHRVRMPPDRPVSSGRRRRPRHAHGYASMLEARRHHRRAGVVGRLRVALLHRRHGGSVHACSSGGQGRCLMQRTDERMACSRAARLQCLHHNIPLLAGGSP